MAESRPKPDAEFRRGSVRIVTGAGQQVARAAQVARDLGIDETTSAGWVPRARKTGEDGRRSGCEREESLRLRRQGMGKSEQTEQLEREREVLRRCTVLRVKQPRRTRRCPLG